MRFRNSRPAKIQADAADAEAVKAAVEKTVATFGQRPGDPSSSQVRIVFYVFDLLILGGKDVMGKTLRERRTLLETKVLPLLGEPIRYSSQLDAPINDLIAQVKHFGFEGIVAKNPKSSYEPSKRSGSWKKLRINRGQEFVIGGYTVGGHGFPTKAWLCLLSDGREEPVKVQGTRPPTVRVAAWQQGYNIRLLFAYVVIMFFGMNWATITVTDSTGKRYSLDVEAESTYDAAHLFLTKAKEHIIREPLPIPSLETMFEVTVNGKVHKVSGAKLQRWIMKRREEWKGPRGLLFKQRPILGP